MTTWSGPDLHNELGHELDKPEWGLHHTPTVRDHEEMWVLLGLEVEVAGVVAEANAWKLSPLLLEIRRR